MGVADPVAGHGLFSANYTTLSHDDATPLIAKCLEKAFYRTGAANTVSQAVLPTEWALQGRRYIVNEKGSQEADQLPISLTATGVRRENHQVFRSLCRHDELPRDGFGA